MLNARQIPTKMAKIIRMARIFYEISLQVCGKFTLVNHHSYNLKKKKKCFLGN